MPDVHYVCISDTHFGADNSLLTNLGSGTGEVDPSGPSEVLLRLVQCLRALISHNTGGARPTLVLNGDIFEFALRPDNFAAMAFQRFVELTMPPQPEARLFDPKIFFIPGNHDHHLWESAREIQYSIYLQKVPADTVIEAPWHSTEMFGGRDIESAFANAVIQRCPGLEDVKVITRYPNMALYKGGRLIVFSHGHFTEEVYLMMSTLADAMFNRPPGRSSIDRWEQENFAWIDFFWSMLGRSGLVGQDVGLVYEKMQDAARFGDFVGQAVRSLLDVYGSSRIKRFDRLIECVVKSVVAGRLERARPEKVLADDGAGLRRYLQGPLRTCLEDEMEHGSRPEEVTFVFGHTHKPFEEDIAIEEFITPNVRLYNSGGWVVDRAAPQALFGGAVILLDENLETVSLRMYNEADKGVDYAVKVASAGPHRSGPDSFCDRIKTAVRSDLSPWADFSAAAAAGVNAHCRKLATRLAGAGD